VGLKAVEMFNCSTLDGHLTLASQLSQCTVEYSVHIEVPEGYTLGPGLAT